MQICTTVNTALITAAFSKNDYKLLAKSLNDRIIEPVRSKLIHGFDKVKKSALDAGADGAAISGSGPTVFAITDSAAKAEMIRKEMVETFDQLGIKTRSVVTSVDKTGTRLIK